MKSTILLLLFSMAFAAFSQKDSQRDDVHASLLTGKKKSLLLYSGKTRSYTMDIMTRSVKPSDLPGFANIDRQIVQSTLVPVPEHTDLTNLTPEKEREVLTKYMNYELDFYKKKLRHGYTNLQTEWLNLKGHLFLVWYFDMPKDYKLVSRQIYFSTLFFDQVVDINAPVFKSNDLLHAKSILTKLAASLKTYNSPLDMAQLTRQVNR
ncbi:MAG: hypothetical protein P4L51_20915 [Puia sp.]|nr:hypothetical protein [Puia sp.]